MFYCFGMAVINAFWGGWRSYEMVRGEVTGPGWAGCIALNFFMALALLLLALREDS
jgi:hypothetical protein